jgi:hypothetical protein
VLPADGARVARGAIMSQPFTVVTTEDLLERTIREAGQACIDWANDTGDCHFCNPTVVTGHEEHCPLREYFRALAGAKP